jgi:hypothetical protein
MKPQILQMLRDARDFTALTGAVTAMCEPFGPVHSLRLIHNRRAGRVACFIELELPRYHAALAHALGANTLSGSVCLDVPVGADFGTKARVVALAA